MQTDHAPEMPGESAAARDQIQARIDLLLVDANGKPAAIFRCERSDSAEDWRPRDITVLRNLAQTLSSAIRRYASPAVVPAMPTVALPGIGSTPQNLDWLRRGDEMSIWLQALSADTAFDALNLDMPLPGSDPLADPFGDLDDDEFF
jgi:hypothetical protein